MKLKVAAKAVLRHDGKVLLMNDNGVWDFPGGGIEGDERLPEALKRELQEELGLTEYTLGRVVHADEWFIEKLGLHVVAVFYEASVSERIEHRLSEEHSDARWLTADEARQQNCTPDTLRTLEAMGL